ncbi:uncharacterized protein LOC127879552 isoform X2 [Dreissena polymorpha]|uniref:Uncharacterized protein n=1 Tax=Dreissena polymorpha TaxID=45954 RepID=A0A9D4KDD2_DREPO|nr:uncharacterized protein LOC127879552 isoform X2 [Dreissena polymorpha]XP_052282437.1 uncharacterized protein LOC127879552 isoform X2 [Dreissena polymorpha]KAH3837468.1 hypothetical protein DPMN_110858 [Dreissena polymorpha]
MATQSNDMNGDEHSITTYGVSSRQRSPNNVILHEDAKSWLLKKHDTTFRDNSQAKTTKPFSYPTPPNQGSGSSSIAVLSVNAGEVENTNHGSNSLKLPIILPRPVNNAVPSPGADQNRKQPVYTVHSIPVVNNAPYLAQQLLTQATPAAPLTYKLPRYKYHAMEKHVMGTSAIILPRPDVLLGVGNATNEMCTNSRPRNTQAGNKTQTEAVNRSNDKSDALTPRRVFLVQKGDENKETLKASNSTAINLPFTETNVHNTVGEFLHFTVKSEGHEQSAQSVSICIDRRDGMQTDKAIGSHAGNHEDHLMEAINRVASGEAEFESPETLANKRRKTEMQPSLQILTPTRSAGSANILKDQTENDLLQAHTVKTESDTNATRLSIEKRPSTVHGFAKTMESLTLRYGKAFVSRNIDGVMKSSSDAITAVETNKLALVKNHHLLATKPNSCENKSKNVQSPLLQEATSPQGLNERAPIEKNKLEVSKDIGHSAHSMSIVHSLVSNTDSECNTDSPQSCPIVINNAEATRPPLTASMNPVVQLNKLSGIEASSTVKVATSITGPTNANTKKIYYILSNKDIETLKAKNKLAKLPSSYQIPSSGEGQMAITPATQNSGAVTSGRPDVPYGGNVTVAELLKRKREANQKTAESKSNGTIKFFSRTVTEIEHRKVLASPFKDTVSVPIRADETGKSSKYATCDASEGIKVFRPQDIVINKANRASVSPCSSPVAGNLNSSPEIKQATIDALKRLTFKDQEHTIAQAVGRNDHVSVKIGPKTFIVKTTDVPNATAARRTTLPAPRPRKDLGDNDICRKRRKSHTSTLFSKKNKTDDLGEISPSTYQLNSPCLELAYSLNLIPYHPGLIKQGVMYSVNGAVDNSGQAGSVQDMIHDENDVKFANIVQIFKHDSVPSSYHLASVKLTLSSGSCGEFRRWFDYSDYPCAIHMSDDGVIEHLEIESVRSGLYIVIDCIEGLPNRSRCVVKAVLSVYPPHLAAIPSNTLAIVIGDIFESEAASRDAMDSISKTMSMEEVIKTFLELQKSHFSPELLDRKYGSTTDRSQSPKYHSPLFYSKSMHGIFEQHILPTPVSSRHSIAASDSCSSSVTVRAGSNLSHLKPNGDFTRFSERAMALKIRQNELFASCQRLKITHLKKRPIKRKRREIEKEDHTDNSVLMGIAVINVCDTVRMKNCSKSDANGVIDVVS